MSDKILEGYIPEREFAEELGRSLRTVRNLRNRADGLPYMTVGKSIYIPVEAARQWLASQIRHPNPTA